MYNLTLFVPDMATISVTISGYKPIIVTTYISSSTRFRFLNMHYRNKSIKKDPWTEITALIYPRNIKFNWARTWNLIHQRLVNILILIYVTYWLGYLLSRDWKEERSSKLSCLVVWIVWFVSFNRVNRTRRLVINFHVLYPIPWWLKLIPNIITK